jgi:hypothetical protein
LEVFPRDLQCHNHDHGKSYNLLGFLVFVPLFTRVGSRTKPFL